MENVGVVGMERDGKIETVLRLVVSLSVFHRVGYAALPHRAAAPHNPLGRQEQLL